MKNNRITGPTDLPPAVRDAVNQQMISHRSDEFKTVFSRASHKLQSLLNAKNVPLFLSCSGTGGLEAAILNTLCVGDKVLALSAGYYGDLFAEIAKKHLGDTVTVQQFAPGAAICPDVLKELLQKQNFDAILLTHSESSTGVLNPLPELSKLIRQYSDALILVDAISSVGTTEINMDQWGVDVIITVPQKGLMSPPGLSMIAVSDRVMEIVQSGRAIGSFYFDFKRAFDSRLKNQTAFTPAILSIWGLDAALSLIESEGVAQVFARHKRIASACQQGAVTAGFSLFACEGMRAYGITSLRAPPSISAPVIQKILEEKYQIFVGIGVGAWESQVIRIGHMGWVSDQDIALVVNALADNSF
jgi:aspartate aminotransferase-like enzyme